MSKRIPFLLIIGVLALLVTGCAGGDDTVEVSLDQEFSLAIGERASISGEDLEIEFLEILEESRCPRDATCVWEGRVRCLIEITDGGLSEQKELEAPGLTDEYSVETYGNYQITFRVEPYPEVDQQIRENEYRLLLIIGK